jgi:anti-sigma factor RsiW
VSHPSELISAYLDGELSRPEMQRLLEHLPSCGVCAAELEELQAVRTAVRSLPMVELPSGLFADDRVAVTPIHRNKGVWVGAAAAVIALVIAIAALVTPPPPSVSVGDLNSSFGARVSLDPAFGPAKIAVPLIVEEPE